MLTNPTIDMLRDLGLCGMANAFQDLEMQSEARALDHGDGLPSCSNGRRQRAVKSASRPELEPSDYVMTPRSRTPISVQRAVSIAVSS